MVVLPCLCPEQSTPLMLSDHMTSSLRVNRAPLEIGGAVPATLGKRRWGGGEDEGDRVQTHLKEDWM